MQRASGLWAWIYFDIKMLHLDMLRSKLLTKDYINQLSSTCWFCLDKKLTEIVLVFSAVNCLYNLGDDAMPCCQREY